MPSPGAPVVQEVRYAVVMYGGISLAIYMNGIAQELLSLVKSTAPSSEDDTRFRYTDENLDRQGTSAVYRDLARFLIRKPQFTTVDQLRETPAQLRYNVDILSGTSAGGINGMFLAKALANGVEDLKVLEQMWIEEGDISLLLNDKQSLQNLPVKYKTIPHPTSLLNSDRMYHRLYRALSEMDKGASQAFTSRVDLFMTATDLRGLTKRIQLSDREVEERKYNTVFHFQWLEEARENDFVGTNNPFLGFVARCTSCIVPAFEPMRLIDIERSLGNNVAADDRWSSFFSAYWREQLGEGLDQSKAQEEAKKDFRTRSFGDGGYLDNRPFTYATKTLAHRTSDLPVRRKLLYVEPDPVDILDDGPEARPNVLDHALKALTVANNEAIRDDLEAVRRRNELLDRTVRIIEHVEASARVSSMDQENRAWRVDLNAKEARSDQRRSPAQLGYMHLRVASVTDQISAQIGKQLGFDEDSVYQSCVRYLVRHWRDSSFEQSDVIDSKDGRPTRFGTYLSALDFGLEERRIQFLHRKINRIVMTQQSSLDPISMALLQVKRDLNELAKKLYGIKDGFYRGELCQSIGSNEQLQISLRDLGDILRAPTDLARAAAAKNVLESKPKWESIRAQLTAQAIEVGVELEAYRAEFEAKFNALNTESGPLQGNFSHYELFDELILPMTYGTGAIESNYVEIHRISPLDAPSLVPGTQSTVADHPTMRQKLVGTSLGHFGAFFDRGGRARDILWGRLDAAERLITTLMPAAQEDRSYAAERQHFLNRAQVAILCDAPEVPESKDPKQSEAERRDMDRLRLHLFQKILDQPLAENADDAEVQTWINDSGIHFSEAERRSLARVVYELLRRRTDPLPTVKSGPRLPLRVQTADKVALSGRSTAILGSLFDGLYSSPRWRVVSWAGSFLAGIGQVLVPGSFDASLGRHWYWLGVTFSGGLALTGLLFKNVVIQQYGLYLLLGLMALGGVLRWLRGFGPDVSLVGQVRRVVTLALFLAFAGLFWIATASVAAWAKSGPFDPYSGWLTALFAVIAAGSVLVGLYQFAVSPRRKA